MEPDNLPAMLALAYLKPPFLTSSVHLYFETRS